MIVYRIRELMDKRMKREKGVLTVAQVARESGIARVPLVKMVNNSGYTTSTDKLNLLCRYFDCKLHELVEYVPDPPGWKPPPPRPPRKLKNPPKQRAAAKKVSRNR